MVQNIVPFEHLTPAIQVPHHTQHEAEKSASPSLHDSSSSDSDFEPTESPLTNETPTVVARPEQSEQHYRGFLG